MSRASLLAITGLTLVACSSPTVVHTQRADQLPPTTTGSTTGTPTPDGTQPPIGSDTDDGLGDVLYPDLGNPGLDVLHYDITLAYDPNSDSVDATVGIDAQLTSDRTEITLDAIGLSTTTVTVDGEPVDAVADDPELRVPLPQPYQAGDTLRIVVEYGFVSEPTNTDIGWFNTDGGSYVLNEPDGARTWLPSNDHPSDKATYTFTLSVPLGVTAVANGTLADHRTEPNQEVWVWQQDLPMTTYLIQLLTGDYEVVPGVGPNNLPLTNVVLRSDRQTMQPFIDVTPAMLDYFDDYFGPYPLDAYGLAITDSFGGLAMETQGRSLFSREDFLDGVLGIYQQLLLSHELSHQWFGDAVSPATWSDIWLNESFATYGQWMWFEHIGLDTVSNQANLALGGRPQGSTGFPTVDELFGYNSYDGGAVVLHALRLTIGDDKFFLLLQRWIAENNGSSRTSADFIALTEEVAGESMTEFFDTWLYASIVPNEFPTPA